MEGGQRLQCLTSVHVKEDRISSLFERNWIAKKICCLPIRQIHADKKNEEGHFDYLLIYLTKLIVEI